MGVTREQLNALADPIEDYKFRVQSTKYGKCTIISYIDSRQVQDRLDDVLGAENWQDQYQVIDGNLFCGISVNVDDGNGRSEWITKWDVGTESAVEKDKGSSSDSFKRAAVKWKVGRFLYSLGIVTLKAVEHTNKKEYPAKSDGTILWSVDEITAYCREITAKGITDDTKFQKPSVKSTPKPQPAKQTTPPTSTGKPPSGMQPNTAFDSTKEPTSDVTERKAKATKAFETLDKAKVLGYIIKDLKKKYTSIATFIEKEPIDVVLSTYEAVKQFKKDDTPK